MILEVHDGEKVRQYTVKAPEAITIADYRMLRKEPIPDDLKANREVLVELLKRLTGCPKAHLRRAKPAAMITALERMAEVVEAMGRAEREKEDPQPPPETFEHGGVTYVVPQDIERDTYYGQWEDLHNVLIPQAGDSEADIAKAVVACMCLPEGADYGGEQVTRAMGAFEELPMALALSLCAFFFMSSHQFKSDTEASIHRSLISNLHKQGQALNSSPNDTAPTLAYGKPQS